ncbi:MAG: TrkH family potassium uptake protein [Candidatus Omnitrophica bacterium]|nr:TrkH family potassium uptake protein [Candidatus Omnitrophota bacterium]
MLLKPRLADFKIIGYYLGKVILGLGLMMTFPILLGLFLKEINPLLDFLITLELSVIIGLILTKLCFTEKELNWMQAMVVVSLTWISAMFLGALPLYLSGHWRSYLDACFETMSGFATTGLTLVCDLDHLSYTHNLWRHLMMFMGGQGIIIVALAFFFRGFSGALRIYVGEAREERIFPNVIHTARFIWLVSIVYLVLGTVGLGLAGILNGMRPLRAFFHGLCIFMTAFDTGGFTPQSQNILYYHSGLFELLTMVIMILGAINFQLHYHIWTGRRKEILRDIETQTFFMSVVICFLIVMIGLIRWEGYPPTLMLFRKGAYQLLSAHTGTGYQTIYPWQWKKDWNHLALSGILIAMALGGAICSTAGAIKMVRIGSIFKILLEEIKRIILPERAVFFERFHHIKEIFIEDKFAKATLFITLLYIGFYGLGAIIGMSLGYPFLDSLFESISATANVGLSCGITHINMPDLLKITYILQMWAGRLEFISVFTLAGFLIAVIKGKR